MPPLMPPCWLPFVHTFWGIISVRCAHRALLFLSAFSQRPAVLHAAGRRCDSCLARLRRTPRASRCLYCFFVGFGNGAAISHGAAYGFAPWGIAVHIGTKGRPSQELAGDHPKNWRATIPRIGGRPCQELAGDHPNNWQATKLKTGEQNPRTGGGRSHATRAT